jgi:predicted dehydrogenase
MKEPVNLAVVGTGYVADQYAKTLVKHPELKLVGAFDRNKENLIGFCRLWPTRQYTSLQEILDDPEVALVVNLTNPRSHFEVNQRSLEAGKHVYSEKPLAMTSESAQTLVALAQERGLRLAAAPCSLLSPTAQTIWKALQDGVVGRTRLVYANFDDGMIAPNMLPWLWLNDFGVPWPGKDEFEVGCTFEHAGYVLTWLAAFFGAAKRVTAFASCQIPDKGIPVDGMAPDFSVGCIEYAEGVVARVTCGLVAPRDKSITIIGDQGIIYTGNVRHDDSPVYIRQIPSTRWHGAIERRLNPIRVWLERLLPSVPWSGQEWTFQKKYPFAIKPSRVFVARDKRVDFCRGLSEMAESIRQNRPCRLSANLGLHIVDLIDALQHPERSGGRRNIESTFEPIRPLEWIR